MANDLMDVIRPAAAEAYPNEACGVVIRVGKKSVAVPCKNTSSEPKCRFVIDPTDYALAADRGEVIGIWHTHIDIAPTPSDADLAGIENSELPWYIVSIYKKGDDFEFVGPTVTEPTGFKMGYLERPYVFGVFDCYSLVVDYYQRERGLTLGSYPHIESFWAKGFNFFGDNWAKEGFRQLIDQQPEPGDVFLIQTDKFDAPNHVAIYLGDDMIMHHCHGRLSRRDVYGGYWLKHTVAHLRHKTTEVQE